MKVTERESELNRSVAMVCKDIAECEHKRKLAMDGYNATLKDLRSQLANLLHEIETGQKRIGDDE